MITIDGKVFFVSKEGERIYVEDEKGVCLSVPHNELEIFINALNKLK